MAKHNVAPDGGRRGDPPEKEAANSGLRPVRGRAPAEGPLALDRLLHERLRLGILSALRPGKSPRLRIAQIGGSRVKNSEPSSRSVIFLGQVRDTGCPRPARVRARIVWRSARKAFSADKRRVSHPAVRSIRTSSFAAARGR